MSMRLTSLIGISFGDEARFIYYLPTDRMEFEWINRWFDENLELLGDRAGPDVFVIGSTPSRRETYLHEVGRLIGREWGRSGHWPYLIVSVLPLPGVRSESDDYIELPLEHVPTVSELGRVFDMAFDAVKHPYNGRHSPYVRSELKRLLADYAYSIRPEQDARWLFRILNSLELKPNFMGIGLNINEMARAMSRWRSRRRANTD